MINSYDPIYGIPPDLVRGPEADFLPLSGEVNYGVNAPGMQDLRDAGENGRGLRICIVDTGIDSSHPLLVRNLVKARDFTGSSRGSHDVNGHGTHCSGTCGALDQNISPSFEASIWHGKGLSDSGSGSMSALLRAMEWGLSEGCLVMSCSWGGGTQVDPGTERQLREWAEHPSRPWIFFAGGNSGGATSQTDAPGNSLHVFNWAAVDRLMKPASFSSAGSKIDASAPGVQIWSTRTGGGFQQMSGTSMACPTGASTMALYRNALRLRNLPIPSVYDLRRMMEFRATDAHTPGDDNRTGPGVVTPILLRNLLDEAPISNPGVV